MRRARPAAAAVPAAVPAAALALALAAACTSAPAVVCPGTTVALLGLSSAVVVNGATTQAVPRVPAGDPAVAAIDPVPGVPDCPLSLQAPPRFPPTLEPIAATLAFDDSSQVAALCRTGKEVLYGTRAGTRYTVEASTTGALLSECAASCTAILRAVVVGDVGVDGSGAATGFTGGLFEVLSPEGAGSCGTCFADPPGACAARYALEATR